jgi:hypothetical protein
MQRADYVIAAIALVALVGSLLGVALYDEPEFRRYDVRVVTHSGSEEIFQVSLTGNGDSDSDTWNLTTANITQAQFTISIQGGAAGTLRPDPTTVEVVLIAPNGDEQRSTLSLSGTGQQSDSATVTMEFHELPRSHDRVLARDAASALDDDDEPRIPTGLDATGDWTIEATITGGGGLAVSPETVTVRVQAEYDYYSATAVPHLPDPGPVA